MDESNTYEVTAVAGKQVAFVKVFREDENRQVVIGFSDETELAIEMEVRSVTSAILYKSSGGFPEALARYDEHPEESPYKASIKAATATFE
jgi:hypothetical protein